MHRSRSQLNNLAPSRANESETGFMPQNPIGSNKQTDEIQRRLNEMGLQVQQMQSEQQAAPYATQSDMGIHFDNGQSAPNTAMGQPQEFDQIQSNLEQISQKLNMFAKMGEGSTAQSQALVRQNEQITAELLEMRKLIGSLENKNGSGLGAEMAAIRQALEANNTSISRQLSQAGSGSVDTGKFAMAVEASHEKIANALQTMRNDISEVSGTSEGFKKTLEARHNEVASQIGSLQESINSAMGNPDLYAQTVEKSHRELISHFEALKNSVSAAQSADNHSGAPDLTSVEMRLEEITRAVVALSADHPNVDNLDRIEARIGDIAKNISNIQPSGNDEALGRIENGLSDLKSHLANTSADVSGGSSAFEQHMQEVRSELAELNNNFNSKTLPENGSGQITGLVEQLSELSEKFDAQMLKLDRDNSASAFIGENIEQSALLSRFDDLATQIQQLKREPFDPSSIGPMLENGASVDNSNAFASLESQLDEIKNKIGNTAPVEGGSISFDPITEQLNGIEQQLAASRDIAIEVASQAAEDAVERMAKEMPASGGNGSEINSEALQNLSNDLRRWRETVTDKNTESVEVFESVKDTLAVMADRLSQIEEGIKSGQSYQFGPTGETDVSHDFAKPEQVQHIENPQEQVKPEAILESVFAASENQADREQINEELHAEPALESSQSETTPQETQMADPFAEAHDEVIQQEADGLVVDAPQSGEDTGSENPLFAAAVAEANSRRAPDTQEVAQEAMPEVETASPELEQTQQENDVPLEPGSGEPDLAALVRQANEKRRSNAKNGTASSSSEFLASARRAAQAAAQEASMVQAEIDQTTSKGLMSSLPELLKKRKKVLIMGAAAVLMIAIAIPLASVFLGSDKSVFSENMAQPIIQESAQQPTDTATLTNSDGSNVEITQSESSAPAVDPGVVNSITPADETVDEVENVEATNSAAEEVQNTSINDTASDVTNSAQSITKIDVSNLGFVNNALRVAAESGDPVALFEVGRRFGEGVGTQKDLPEAAKWYQRSAEFGFAPAQYIIGNFNEKGIGVERNLAKAVSWYELASEGGNIVAMHNLGVLYATPKVISDKPDMAKAFSTFSQAAEFGVRDSQVNMGIFYTKGIGTEVDLIEAYKWFAISSAGGDKDAGSKMQAIKAALRPDQLEAARKIVENWTPSTPTQTANDVTIPDEWKPQSKPAPVAKVDKKTIVQMQAVLTKLGYNAGTADGIMGNKTREAIREYRKKAGLRVGDQVDAELLRSLTAAISS